jgi:hypothetical protein
MFLLKFHTNNLLHGEQQKFYVGIKLLILNCFHFIHLHGAFMHVNDKIKILTTNWIHISATLKANRAESN